MQTFWVHESFIETIEKKLAQLNKRARKLGNEESSFKIIGEKFSTFRTEKGVELLDIILRYVEIEISVFDVKLPDWIFIARRDHAFEIPVILAMNGAPIKNEWYDIPSICEHCGHQRRRKVTYVIQNEKTLEYKIIGSSCLKDFLGHKNIDRIVSLYACYQDFFQWIQSHTNIIDKDSARSSGNYIDVIKVLALSSYFINKFGYVKNAGPDEQQYSTSTSDHVREQLWPNSKTVRVYPTDEDYEIAQKTIEYFQEAQNISSYFINLKSILSESQVKSRYINMIVSAPAVYLRTVKPKEEKKEAKEYEYMALEPRRIKKADVTVLDIKKMGSYNFGFTRYLVWFEYKTHLLIWWSTDIDETIYEPGKCIKMSFSIEENKEYKGVKQTRISRVKPIMED